MYRRNASASTADPTAATELVLFATNDGDLYAGQGKSIITNLAKKMAKGQYDTAKAAKLWGYFADSAAQKYAWEFGSRKPGTRSWHQQSSDGNGMFNAATRRAAAAEIEESFREEVQHKAAGLKVSTKARTNGTRADVLREDARKTGYAVDTYSPGDGVTRYRFFSLAEMASKGISEREQSYFGPLSGVHTALGLAAAKKWLARAANVRTNSGKVTMASIRAANAAAGQHFFSPVINKFFAFKVVGGPYGGRYFVTEEKSGFDPRSARRYTLREAVNGGASIRIVGKFNEFMFKEDAIEQARAMARITKAVR